MRTFNTLVTYNCDGETIEREKISVSFTSGEPHPKDRVVVIELPFDGHAGIGKCISLSLSMLEKACGLKIRRVK